VTPFSRGSLRLKWFLNTETGPPLLGRDVRDVVFASSPHPGAGNLAAARPDFPHPPSFSASGVNSSVNWPRSGPNRLSLAIRTFSEKSGGWSLGPWVGSLITH